MKVKNKFAVLYTCHNKTAQLNLAKEFFNRSEYLINNFDVIVTSNSIYDKDSINKITNQFDCKRKQAFFDEKNDGGYLLGVIEQVCNVYKNLTDYELVLHVHPDVYIVSDHAIREIFSKPEKKDFYVFPMHPTFGLPNGQIREKEYAADAWIIKPKDGNNIFKHWKTYKDDPSLRSSQRPAYAERYLYDNINKLECDIGFFDRNPHAGQSYSYERNSGLWQSDNIEQLKWAL